MHRRSADKTFLRLLCIATCVAGAAPALASSFNISPIRVELAGGRRTGALTPQNAGEAPGVGAGPPPQGAPVSRGVGGSAAGPTRRVPRAGRGIAPQRPDIHSARRGQGARRSVVG